MEGIVLDVSALRKAYRNSITQLSNSAVRRKNLDDGMLVEECYICMRGWRIREEMATLRCECPYWTHEACLAKSVFETGGCPTCRKSIDLIDDETVLAKAAADGDTERALLNPVRLLLNPIMLLLNLVILLLMLRYSESHMILHVIQYTAIFLIVSSFGQII